MKKLTLTIILAACSCSLAMAAKPGSKANVLPLEKTPVHFSQTLFADDPIQLGETGLKTSSKTYYMEVSGTQLKQGVSLYTTGEAAVIRVTPMRSGLTGKKHLAPTIEPEELELGTAAGEFNISKSSMSLTASSEQLNNAHPQLFKNTSAFVLDKTLGAGEFKLRTNKAVTSNDRYLIHVFDKNSPFALSLKSDRSSFGNKDKLAVSIDLRDESSQKHLILEDATTRATLISPNGDRYPMNLVSTKRGHQVTIDLDFDLERRPGELWKVVVDTAAENNTNVKRTGELAIDIHPKTAAINRHVQKGSTLSVDLTIEQAGRYEVRAWMFTTQGKKREPASLEYYAQWFEPGTYTVSIPLSKTGKNLRVAQLQLLDQTRLAVLETLN
jgi:hypothetical protein